MKQLLICNNQDEAQFLADKLKLDPIEWDWCGLGSGLGGRRYSEVISLVDSSNLFDQLDGPANRRWLKRVFATKIVSED